MKTAAVAPMPRCTPSAMMTSTAIHTRASGTITPGTNSTVTPGSPTWRKSPKKKLSGSSPHALLTEKSV